MDQEAVSPENTDQTSVGEDRQDTVIRGEAPRALSPDQPSSQPVEEVATPGIDDLKKQIEAQNDKYLRLMAEFDNYKRRTSREYERLVESASERLMLELIEVREDFSRALLARECAEIGTFVKGMELVFQRFEQVLARNGLAAYGAAGEEFSAELHDALMKLPNKEIPADHISEVFEKGYRLRNKIVRHAKVVVSAGPEQSPQEEKTAARE